MEAVRSSETLMPYRNTRRRHNPKDLHSNMHRMETSHLAISKSILLTMYRRPCLGQTMRRPKIRSALVVMQRATRRRASTAGYCPAPTKRASRFRYSLLYISMSKHLWRKRAVVLPPSQNICEEREQWYILYVKTFMKKESSGTSSMSKHL